MSLVYQVPRREWLRRRLDRAVVERIGDLDIVVPAGVFNPVVFRTGKYFSEVIADSDHCDPSELRCGEVPEALDCTTGTGAQALVLGRRGFRVTAVDVNPSAVHAARTNVFLNRLESRVSVVEGNLFAPVAGRRFHLIVCAPPLFRGEPGNGFELSWRSPDFLERFASGLPGVLLPTGSALVLFTTDGDQAGFFRALDANDLAVSVFARKHFGNEIITIYRIRTASGFAATGSDAEPCPSAR